jgi:hypothetical protein
MTASFTLWRFTFFVQAAPFTSLLAPTIHPYRYECASRRYRPCAHSSSDAQMGHGSASAAARHAPPTSARFLVKLSNWSARSLSSCAAQKSCILGDTPSRNAAISDAPSFGRTPVMRLRPPSRMSVPDPTTAALGSGTRFAYYPHTPRGRTCAGASAESPMRAPRTNGRSA